MTNQSSRWGVGILYPCVLGINIFFWSNRILDDLRLGGSKAKIPRFTAHCSEYTRENKIDTVRLIDRTRSILRNQCRVRLNPVSNTIIYQKYYRKQKEVVGLLYGLKVMEKLTAVASNRFSLESAFNRRLRSFCSCCESAVDFLWQPPATSRGLFGGGRHVMLLLDQLQQLPANRHVSSIKHKARKYVRRK